MNTDRPRSAEDLAGATFKAREARLVGAGPNPQSTHKLRPDSVGTALEGGTRAQHDVPDGAGRRGGHIAIVSNGPSAELFDRANRGDFDVVVGVNWTVARWACDWWCLCDWTTFADHTPRGNPKLFIRRFAADKLPRYAPQCVGRFGAAPEVLLHEQIAPPPLPNGAGRWNAFSGLAALGLARHLQAARITVFGADMTGDRDHTGQFGHSRTPDRWALERRIWHALVGVLEAEGIVVERVGGGESSQQSARSIQ